MTGMSGVKSRQLWEVMDTVTTTNDADIEFIVVVNTEFWNGLTDEQREIISTAAVNAENDVRDRMSAIEAAAFDEAKANGMTIYHPTEEEMAAWREAAKPVYEAFLAHTGDLGKQVFEAAQKF